ncbi:hypothetical protein JCGZ_01833 [Jatropha curcas]|uniref:Endoplasmic reticulum transmembrane protein n=1 Tax=Jatropha curcas TaxID=180498 RepID=A0A067JFS7_JATCU|nr:hypothetical protein JCGZ_01833 [Jatropha curcas]
MIQLLYTVIFAEMALILTLLFKTPLRKLVILTLDRVKQGRGPVMVKTVGGTVFIVLLSSLYSMFEIQNRSIEAAPNPTDQVLMARHMLEASLMGTASVFDVNRSDSFHGLKCTLQREVLIRLWGGQIGPLGSSNPNHAGGLGLGTKPLQCLDLLWFRVEIYIKNYEERNFEAEFTAKHYGLLQFEGLIGIGFLLFLSLMIDRLHHYIRELRLLRKAMEAAKKQSRGFEDVKNGNSE